MTGCQRTIRHHFVPRRIAAFLGVKGCKTTDDERWRATTYHVPHDSKQLVDRRAAGQNADRPAGGVHVLLFGVDLQVAVERGQHV
jgi:hypothetical protein